MNEVKGYCLGPCVDSELECKGHPTTEKGEEWEETVARMKGLQPETREWLTDFIRSVEHAAELRGGGRVLAVVDALEGYPDEGWGTDNGYEGVSEGLSRANNAARSEVERIKEGK
jgi:hypothetical protein